MYHKIEARYQIYTESSGSGDCSPSCWYVIATLYLVKIYKSVLEHAERAAKRLMKFKDARFVQGFRFPSHLEHLKNHLPAPADTQADSSAEKGEKCSQQSGLQGFAFSDEKDRSAEQNTLKQEECSSAEQNRLKQEEGSSAERNRLKWEEGLLAEQDWWKKAEEGADEDEDKNAAEKDALCGCLTHTAV